MDTWDRQESQIQHNTQSLRMQAMQSKITNETQAVET